MSTINSDEYDAEQGVRKVNDHGKDRTTLESEGWPIFFWFC